MIELIIALASLLTIAAYQEWGEKVWAWINTWQVGIPIQEEKNHAHKF
jgi:hypothetical protein